MKISAFVLIVVAQFLSVESSLSHISLPEVVNGGGVFVYQLNVSQCTVHLPRQIPAYSSGFTVYDLRIVMEGAMAYRMYFSSTRAVSGKPYNLTGNVVRFTQVTMVLGETMVEMIDVDERTPTLLASGSLKCHDQHGISRPPQSVKGKDLTTVQEIIKHLLAGKNLLYAVTWDECSPETSSGITWAGIISDYQFQQEGGVEFTQLIDFAKKQFYLNVSVTETEVTVQSYTVLRMTRTQSKPETKKCQLGNGIDVTINNYA